MADTIELDERRASAAGAPLSTSTEQLNPSADDDFPEGGYGWVVTACAAVIASLFIGVTFNWGIIQHSLVATGLAPASTLAWVGSTSTGCISAFAALNSRVLQKVGARGGALMGVCSIGTGELLASFSTRNVPALFVTAGFVTGLGYSMSLVSITIVPAQYFRRRRGLSNGLVYAGGGIGGGIFSFILSAIATNYGPAWTFRALALITFSVGVPCALLLKERISLRAARWEWRLFRDPKFVILFFAGAIATFPLFVPPFFLPQYADSLGLSTTTGAALVAGFSFASGVGRIGFGLTADMLGPLNSLLAALVAGALSTLVLWPVSTSLAPLITFVIINGIANGGFFSLMPTVVLSVFGVSRAPVAMSLIITGWGGGYFAGAPIAGLILSAFSGGSDSPSLEAYRPAIFYAGSLSLAAAGLVLLERLSVSRKLLFKA